MPIIGTTISGLFDLYRLSKETYLVKIYALLLFLHVESMRDSAGFKFKMSYIVPTYVPRPYRTRRNNDSEANVSNCGIFS